jgi:hypothetical protein
VWRNTLHSATDKRADGDGDGDVDMDDYHVWKNHYGETLPIAGSSAASGSAVVVSAPPVSAASDVRHESRHAFFAPIMIGATRPWPAAGHRVHPTNENSFDSVSRDDALLAWNAMRTRGAAPHAASIAAGESGDSTGANESDLGCDKRDAVFTRLGLGSIHLGVSG